MKRADRSHAPIALILGDDEVSNHQLGLKELRTQSPQVSLSEEETIDRLARVIEAD